MIEFLRMSAQHENKDLDLEIPVSVDEAGTFIHGMRVELSRMKNLMQNRGKTVKPFKLLHIKTKACAERGKCIIVLRKATSRMSKFHDIIEDAFGDDLGDILNAD